MNPFATSHTTNKLLSSGIILLLSLFCCIPKTYGQDKAVLTITDDKHELYRVSHHFYWLEDSSGEFTIQDASSEPLLSSYQLLDKPAIDFGLSDSYYWLRLIVERGSSDSTRYSIVFHDPRIEEIKFYSGNSSTRWEEMKGGYKMPISDKIHNTPLNVFPIPFHQDREVLYFRIKANGTITRASIESQRDIEELIMKRNFYSGLFGGFLLIVIIYCLSLYFALRQRLFLIYAIIVFVLTICNLSIDGSISYLNEKVGTIILFLFAKFGHLANPAIQYYGILFLNLDKFAPRWLRRFNWTMLYIYLGTSILTWFVPVKIGVLSMQAHGLFLFITLIITSLIVGSRGNRFAKYFTLGCLSYLLGICFEVCHWKGLIPHVGYLTYVSYGQILEICVFTLALNRRISFEKAQLENEKDTANRLAIKQAQENAQLILDQNITLEKKVEARTKALYVINQELKILNEETQRQSEELRLKNQQLEDLNHLKDRFFSIISHDLRAPLKNLSLIMELAISDKITKEETKFLLESITKNTRNLTDLLDNLLYWAQDQLEKCQINPCEFDLSTLLKNTIDLLKSNAESKNISINGNFQNDIIVRTDKNMLDFIVRNLVSNAIKFTPHGGSIQVDMQIANEEQSVSVTDSGVGMDEETLKRILEGDVSSTPGTANEMGVGLGLQLSKEFIERNHGKLMVDSIPGKGSTFCVTFPNQ